MPASVPRSAAKPRLALEDLPDSSAISILKGEGLNEPKTFAKEQSGSEEAGDDEFIDALIEGASELALGTRKSKSDKGGPSAKSEEIVQIAPYSTLEVGKICDGLNKQNRVAKLSSMECQRLFLSLYFHDHVEIAQAIVTDLRVNGLIVYVPKFDLKGPLYLSDIDGDVQIDPTLVGLAPDTGLPPTAGFAAAPNCRRFPAGTCVLKDSNEGGSLEILIPESRKSCVFRPLDVVTVQISCDLSDVRARVPPPRFHLVSTGKQKGTKPKAAEPRKVTSAMIHNGDTVSRVLLDTPSAAIPDEHEQSMYEQLVSLVIKPVLTGVPLRMHQPKARANAGDSESMPGRKTFGGFHNPDTHSATQEAAMAAASEAAAQRRSLAVASQSRRDEYDTTRTIEREVTARMQRLAAEKRSTRRSKAK